MEKSQGLTPSEQYLAKLCEKTFLSLWSFPNLFNDRGRQNGKGVGQELCDLLVVFGNDIVIFSDKSCAFPEGDIHLAWKRWYKRAIKKSADQIYGAERWIKNFPDRIYLEANCSKKLPFPLPENDQIRIHRVAIALNAGKPLKKYYGGDSGSLIISPYMIGDDVINTKAPGYRPFCIGQVDPDKGYIHVFDDESLDIVLGELDTVSDFIQYLAKKEDFILSRMLGGATGEEDLLAFYLRNFEYKEAREFTLLPTQDAPTGVFIDSGLWKGLKKHPQYIARNNANKISYFWDQLIEKFNQHFSDNSLNIAGGSSELTYEAAIRRLASESRFNRRYLAHAFIDFIKKIPPNEEGYKGTRVIQAPNDPRTAYVFLLLSNHGRDYQEYKQVRGYLLSAYCGSVKVKIPTVRWIVGISCEPMGSELVSYDLIYQDTDLWTEADLENAKKEQEELGLLLPENVKWTFGQAIEYPEIPFTKSNPNFGKPKIEEHKKKERDKRKSAKKQRKTNRKK